MKVAIVSALIPTEGKFKIMKADAETLKELLKEFSNIEVYTQHQTVKVLGLEPAKERLVYTPNKTDVQIWIKPHGRLEFGKEYSLQEIEDIGYDIWIAAPVPMEVKKCLMTAN